MATLWRRYWKRGAAAVVFYYGLDWAVSSYRSSIERRNIYEIAHRIGEEPFPVNAKPRRLTVVLNPDAGRRKSEKIFDKEVAPIFHAAGIDFGKLQTKHGGDAKRRLAELDLSETDGLVLVGGDGLVQEAITALLRRPDRERISKFPIGIIPAGTSNATANWLHSHPSCTVSSTAGRAALAIAQDKRLNADALQLTNEDHQIVYALTAFGWGFAGRLTEYGQNLRFTRSWRYGWAALNGALRAWPSPCEAMLAYAPHVFGFDPSYSTPSYVEQDISAFSLHALKVPFLHHAYPISKNARPNSGAIYLSWLPGDLTFTQKISIAYKLFSGHFLEDLPETRQLEVQAFSLTLPGHERVKPGSGVSNKTPLLQTAHEARNNREQPGANTNQEEGGEEREQDITDSDAISHDVPFHVDGESFAATSVLVELIPKALTLFGSVEERRDGWE
eukprot:m.89428 g.89428  ORF g.89428 m.89428 type:complete len:446 (-) comp21519_c0_seq2:40-1377(-)